MLTWRVLTWLVLTWQVTPALALPGEGRLVHVDLAAEGGRRLGGSCLAQAYSQARLILVVRSGNPNLLFALILTCAPLPPSQVACHLRHCAWRSSWTCTRPLCIKHHCYH